MDWNSIKLPQLKQAYAISCEKVSDPFEILERDCRLLSVFYDKPVDHYESMPLNQLNDLRKQMHEAINSVDKVGVLSGFKADGVMFLFKGSKNINDIRELAKANGITKENYYDRISHAIAAFYQPRRWSINGKKYESATARRELFERECPAAIVFSVGNMLAAAAPIFDQLQKTKVYKDLRRGYEAIHKEAEQMIELPADYKEQIEKAKKLRKL